MSDPCQYIVQASSTRLYTALPSCAPINLIVGGEPLLGQKVTKNISVYPKGVGGDKPAWVAFDRQVNGIVTNVYCTLQVT